MSEFFTKGFEVCNTEAERKALLELQELVCSHDAGDPSADDTAYENLMQRNGNIYVAIDNRIG